MAEVRLSDVIDTGVFQDLPAVNGVEKTELVQSGIVSRGSLFNQFANSPSAIQNMPFWHDLDKTRAPNLSSDDPAVVATTDKVNQGEQISRTMYLNMGWAAADLVTQLTMGADPITHIRNRTDAYWASIFQGRVLSAVKGLIADNVANDASDMVIDVSAGTSTLTSVFTRSNFTSAAYTMAEHTGGLTTIVAHPNVVKQMDDSNDIDFIRDSEGAIVMRSYLGHRVVMSSDVPFTVAGGGNDAVYTTIIFGPGAIAWGEGSPNMPVEVQREAAQANGAGVEMLWTRKTWIVHPAGFAVTATPAAISFTPAETEAAATWNRVVARENVPMAFLVSN